MNWTRASAAAVLLAAMPGAVLADPPPTPPAGHRHVVVARGDPAPDDGLFADAAVAKYDADLRRWYETRIAVCEELAAKNADDKLDPGVAGGVGLAVGFVIGIAAGVVLHARYTK